MSGIVALALFEPCPPLRERVKKTERCQSGAQLLARVSSYLTKPGARSLVVALPWRCHRGTRTNVFELRRHLDFLTADDFSDVWGYLEREAGAAVHSALRFCPGLWSGYLYYELDPCTGWAWRIEKRVALILDVASARGAGLVHSWAFGLLMAREQQAAALPGLKPETRTHLAARARALAKTLHAHGTGYSCWCLRASPSSLCKVCRWRDKALFATDATRYVLVRRVLREHLEGHDAVPADPAWRLLAGVADTGIASEVLKFLKK